MTSKQIVLKDLFNDLVNLCHKSMKILGRKKSINYEEGLLPRCLTVWDLTALAIGSTLGTGVYVLAGVVAKELAGPAVIFSFLIAAIASLLAGLCYAEFGARVPKAGSAYAYSYVCIGEFIAFLMGWNLIMEYVIGTASVVKAFSQYLDLLLNDFIKQTLMSIFPINIPGFAKYPDFFSFFITLIFSLALAFGAKESSMVNNVFTVINLSVVVFVIFCGSVVVYTKTGFQNWNLRTTNVPKEYGIGGFLPYGINGILKGAAKCFYGFIGFDCIATAGEEAKNPQKSIPLATVISLFIIFLTYFGISSVLTLMVPYYDLDEKAPLARVFENLGWTITKNAITYGALFALCASLLGALFPLPRIIFAMSQDGLLFKVMGKVHKKFQTPFAGTLTAGFLTGCMSCIFDLEHLISMMSIGTLMAYSIVAVCVLILRYEDKKDEDFTSITFSNLLKQCFRPNLKNSTRLSSTLVTWLVTFFCFMSFILAFHLRQFHDGLVKIDNWLICRTCMLSCLCFVILLLISRQPTPGKSLTFSVPGVPWIPGLSILINVYLMVLLDTSTWIQFGIWILIGLVIYFSYSINHSNESNKHYENGKSISLQTLKL